MKNNGSNFCLIIKCESRTRTISGKFNVKNLLPVMIQFFFFSPFNGLEQEICIFGVEFRDFYMLGTDFPPLYVYKRTLYSLWCSVINYLLKEESIITLKVLSNDQSTKPNRRIYEYTAYLYFLIQMIVQVWKKIYNIYLKNNH